MATLIFASAISSSMLLPLTLSKVSSKLLCCNGHMYCPAQTVIPMKALLHSSSDVHDCNAALESLHWERILEKVSAIFVASGLDIFCVASSAALALAAPSTDGDDLAFFSPSPSNESLAHASSFAPTPFLFAASRCIFSQTLILSSKLSFKVSLGCNGRGSKSTFLPLPCPLNNTHSNIERHPLRASGIDTIRPHTSPILSAAGRTSTNKDLIRPFSPIPSFMLGNPLPASSLAMTSS
mmetsp:Transcript_17356/g.25863  ORF Transcript_17356/g.25863 Transcript_17356/m.25863 type:complete len:238 (+) Transcript_17356:136-849(+)